jgi:hypothetical protein
MPAAQPTGLPPKVLKNSVASPNRSRMACVVTALSSMDAPVIASGFDD